MNVANNFTCFDLVFLFLELILVKKVYAEVFFFVHGVTVLKMNQQIYKLSPLPFIRLLVVFAILILRRFGL